MKFRSLLRLIAAAVFAVPALAMAAPMISITGLTLTGIGVCFGPDSNPTSDPLAPIQPNGQCYDLAKYPIATNVPGYGGYNPLGVVGAQFDQLILYDYPAVTLGSTTLDPQAFKYIPGDTGGGSAGPDSACTAGVVHPITLNRSITLDGDTQPLLQSGTLTVGWCYDTLNIDPTSVTFHNVDGIQGNDVTVTIGGVSNLQASIDPDGDLTVGISAIPVPSSIALLGLGLAGIGLRRRQRVA